MSDINIILNHSVPSTTIQLNSVGQAIPTSGPEHPGAAHHRHLPHVVHRRVPPDDAQRAPVVGPSREDQVHDHQESELVLARPGIDALRFPDCGRRGLRALRQRVVHYRRHAEHGEGRLNGLGDADGGRLAGRGRADDDVVEVEVEVGLGFVCCLGWGDGDEEEEGEEEGGGGDGGGRRRRSHRWVFGC